MSENWWQRFSVDTADVCLLGSSMLTFHGGVSLDQASVCGASSIKDASGLEPTH